MLPLDALTLIIGLHLAALDQVHAALAQLARAQRYVRMALIMLTICMVATVVALAAVVHLMWGLHR
jgi:hypothetical protein